MVQICVEKVCPSHTLFVLVPQGSRNTHSMTKEENVNNIISTKTTNKQNKANTSINSSQHQLLRKTTVYGKCKIFWFWLYGYL